MLFRIWLFTNKELNSSTKTWEDVAKVSNIIGEFGITSYLDKNIYYMCRGKIVLLPDY